jgi:hypothetical protein
VYIEPLIGPMTISTMPEQTIVAVLDHGNIVAGTIEQGMRRLAKLWSASIVSISALPMLPHDWNE